METRALAHLEKDYVAVATDDLKKGESVEIAFLDTGKKANLKVNEDVPLGHKVALRDLKKGDNIIEYGEVIGAATKDIKAGDHVHVHNIKSLRWQ